jgi:hypothetical protein
MAPVPGSGDEFTGNRNMVIGGRGGLIRAVAEPAWHSNGPCRFP